MKFASTVRLAKAFFKTLKHKLCFLEQAVSSWFEGRGFFCIEVIKLKKKLLVAWSDILTVSEPIFLLNPAYQKQKSEYETSSRNGNWKNGMLMFEKTCLKEGLMFYDDTSCSKNMDFWR